MEADTWYTLSSAFKGERPLVPAEWCLRKRFDSPAGAPSSVSASQVTALGQLTRTVPSPYSLLWCHNSRWSRREEADFYRTVSTFGVEFDRESGRFKWDRFRSLARLDRKYDETITEYFHAFYHMCQTVCGKFRSEERGEWYLRFLSCVFLSPCSVSTEVFVEGASQ